MGQTDSRSYATPTRFEFHSEPLKRPKNTFPVGLDIGYSSTKVYSPFGRHIFPSFVREVAQDRTFSYESGTDMKIRDENGKIWYIGSLAQRYDLTQYPERTMLHRRRVKSPEYRVLFRAAIALALMHKTKDGALVVATKQSLRVSTGLPAEYLLDQDNHDARKQFVGDHRFDIQFATDPEWIPIAFTVKTEHLNVLSQPFGTLFALAGNQDGETTETDIMNQRNLVLDGGFLTVDTFYNMQGVEGDGATWDKYGMREVYARTVADIRKATNDDRIIHVSDLDRYILSPSHPGEIEWGSGNYYNFMDDLQKNAQAVARELVEALNSAYNRLLDFDSLIVTGGSGQAYFEVLREAYPKKARLAVNEAKGPRGFAPNFANAVGFYNFEMFLLSEAEDAEALVAATEAVSKHTSGETAE